MTRNGAVATRAFPRKIEANPIFLGKSQISKTWFFSKWLKRVVRAWETETHFRGKTDWRKCGLPLKWISVYLLRTCISVSKFQFTCNFSLLIKFSVYRYFTLPAWISVYLLFSLLMKIPVYLQFQFTLQDFDLPLISVYSKIQFTCNFCLPRNILAQSYFRTWETRTHFRGATDLRKGDLPQIWISVYLLCDMIFCKQISVYPQFQLTLWNFRFTAISC